MTTSGMKKARAMRKEARVAAAGVGVCGSSGSTCWQQSCRDGSSHKADVLNPDM